MKAISQKIRVAVTLCAMLLAIMAFPSTLYAKDYSFSASAVCSKIDQHHLFLADQDLGRKLVKEYSTSSRRVTVIDDDVRLRAATALVSDPELARHATNGRSQIRILVITADPLLLV